MAASKALKEQAARLLAMDKTEFEVAAQLGLGRSSIQRWKKQESFQAMIQSARSSAHMAKVENNKNIATTSHAVLESVTAIQASETDVAMRLWTLFTKLEAKTLAALEATSVDDISPRNLPSLIRACTDVVQVGLIINDRVSGMATLVDGYQRIEQARQKESRP